MNPEESFPSTAGKPALTAEGAAAGYIAAQLPKARKTLKRGRMVGAIMILVVGIYISVISVTTIGFFQPRAAAEVASGMVTEHLANKGPELVGQLEKEIPILIRQLPDYILQEVPRYRLEVERTLETELQAHCKTLSKEVGEQMDVLMDTHKAELEALTKTPEDRAALQKIIPNLDQIVNDFLATSPAGTNAGRHISDLASELHEIDQRVDRLANGKDLTPEEQKVRRSLAVLARAIKSKSDEPQTTGVPVKKLVKK